MVSLSNHERLDVVGAPYAGSSGVAGQGGKPCPYSICP
jgi:hypothetical protein